MMSPRSRFRRPAAPIARFRSACLGRFVLIAMALLATELGLGMGMRAFGGGAGRSVSPDAQVGIGRAVGQQPVDLAAARTQPEPTADAATPTVRQSTLRLVFHPAASMHFAARSADQTSGAAGSPLSISQSPGDQEEKGEGEGKGESGTANVPTSPGSTSSIETPLEVILDALRSAAAIAEQSAGGTEFWIALDPVFADLDPTAPTMSAARAVVERLPESRAIRGRTILIREPAIEYVEALRALEDDFMQNAWPTLESDLRATTERLSSALRTDGPDDACSALGHALRLLHIEDPGRDIPVVLVTHMQSPGGITYRTRAGAVCVVRITRPLTTQTHETVVHEAIHAIDLAATEQADSILTRLRAALVARGVGETQAAHRDAWHTLFFLAAAEAVRICIDPQHQDVGLLGYYERAGAVATLVGNAWAAHRAGEITVETMIERIADETAAAAALMATESQPSAPRDPGGTDR